MAVAFAGSGVALQIDPTAEPGAQFQANPTSTPNLPIRVSPTEPPPPEPPDDVQANPTEPPPREPDDVQVNPTQAPSIDDVADPSAGGTVRVIKRDCPPGVDEDTLLLLSQALDTCATPHDGVTFTLNHAGGSDVGITAGGEVEWTNVPLGDIEIIETLPDGYAIPIVHCGFTESPGGGVQHPAIQNAADEIIDGSLPVDGAELVCYWMNIKSGDASGTIRVHMYDCPAGVPANPAPYSSLDWIYQPGYTNVYDYFTLCPDAHEGITLTLDHSGGSESQVTAAEAIVFEGVGLGQFTITAELPDGYGDPIVYCAFPQFGLLHPVLQPSTGGMVTDSMDAGGGDYHCSWFNIPLEGATGTDDVAGTHGSLERRLS